MTPVIPSRSYSLSHSRMLGFCWAIYGAIRLLIALWLAGFAPTATMMFGALLGRVPDPYALMNAFHFLYLLAVVWSAAAGAIGVVAGVALLLGKLLARPLAICAALLSLSGVPLGLILGAYTLIVLLPVGLDQNYFTVPRAA